MLTRTLVLALLLSTPALAQNPGNDAQRARRDKIEDILRQKDLRTPFDSRLVGLLGDPDPMVRREATLAYGSIQDSAVIGLLTRNLGDSDPETQEAAAFALGQTGTVLGGQGRQQLEHDLIWNRLHATGAAGRLIEEIGKFGTRSGLDDLMTRVGNVSPVEHPERLMMSIARFAIRGITSDDAVRFLLRYIQPGAPVPWQAVYALQRIGQHPETQASIEFVRLLGKQKDPLVRMNAATLLGKLRDSGGAQETLLRLAEHDGDWRVRVNAFKALSLFSWTGNTSVVAAFRRAFFDVNTHVAVTALSGFSSIGVDTRDSSAAARESFHQLGLIAENASGGYVWQAQSEAALVLARIAGTLPSALASASTSVRPKLHARLIEAAGESRDTAAVPLLLGAVAEDDAGIRMAALSGLLAWCHAHPTAGGLADHLVEIASGSLTSGDAAVATTAAALLGDSLLWRSSSVPRLMTALGDMRPPHDTEAMQEIIATLGKLGDSRAVPSLLGQLENADPSVGRAAALALRSLTGNDYTSRIPRRAEPLYVDMDFPFLRAMKDVIRVRLETSRGDVIVDLYKRNAPFTVMSIMKLAQQKGFYRGLVFHRVVPNFVVQGGDPRGDGWGGPGYALRSEFSPLAYETGTVGIASAGKDTEGSQFFIAHSPQPHLDGRYTIVGKVVAGMEVVNKLQVDDRIYDIVFPK